MAVYAYPYHHCIVWEAELGRRKLPFGQFWGESHQSRIPQRCALLACSRHLPGRPLIEVATFHELVKLQSIAQSGGLTISLAGASARPLRSFLQESGRSQAKAQA
jgi:hypothetical protein